MESIITIATVLTMYFNAANDVNAPYLYNSDLEDGVIHKIEVYEQNIVEAKVIMQSCENRKRIILESHLK